MADYRPVCPTPVALRKESVDRNFGEPMSNFSSPESLSARRAWIEIALLVYLALIRYVALRKESVDRNYIIKITVCRPAAVALRKESVDRNNAVQVIIVVVDSRSPQGERG